MAGGARRRRPFESGALLRALGKPTEAAAAYRRAIALDPNFAAAPYNLGNLLCDAGRLPDAEAAYRSALAARADYPDAYNALGTVLQRRGRLADAAEAFRAAAQHAPRWVEPATNLGVALLGLERYDDARQALQAALAIDPSHASAHGNLGAVYLRAGCPIAAEQATCDAIALAPNEHRWITNLAVALQMQGRHAETETCYRHSLKLRSDYASGHGNLLFALNYRDDLSAEAIFAEYRNWDACHARGLAQNMPFDLDRTPGRRLRVGFVSPDLRQHAVALFAEPLLQAFDRRAIELFCYAEVPVEDATTARFRMLAAHWRTTVGVSDEELVTQIRQDRIDVLVDMAGHSAGNRLLVFARRPAPVQIAYLLGHGYTSGLSAMDAFLADDALAPAGADALFSEQVIRLPRVPFAYRPPAEMPPVAALPAAGNGCVTFGYFGRPERLNAGVIATWSRILHAVPFSRLVLNNRSFQERAFRRLFLDRFTAHDIGRDRVELTYTAPQPRTWAAYGTIDIALDPFPHNAGTTTIEALWQGVPVVTLAGRPTVGGSAPRSCTRLDWTIGSPATRTLMLRAQWQPRATSTRWPRYAPRCGRGWRRHRCWTPMGWRAVSSMRCVGCGRYGVRPPRRDRPPPPTLPPPSLAPPSPPLPPVPLPPVPSRVSPPCRAKVCDRRPPHGQAARSRRVGPPRPSRRRRAQRSPARTPMTPPSAACSRPVTSTPQNCWRNVSWPVIPPPRPRPTWRA